MLLKLLLDDLPPKLVYIYKLGDTKYGVFTPTVLVPRHLLKGENSSAPSAVFTAPYYVPTYLTLPVDTERFNFFPSDLVSVNSSSLLHRSHAR